MKKIIIRTELGDIFAELYEDKAPVTAGNFLRYVEDHAYDGASTFYRVVRPDNQPDSPVKIEVIQGGLRKADGSPAQDYGRIAHETTRETGLRHLDGTLSMARMEPGSATSEFFICIGPQEELDYYGRRNPDRQGFAAFGRVTEGMEIVRKIQQGEDFRQMLVEPAVILSIELVD